MSAVADQGTAHAIADRLEKLPTVVGRPAVVDTHAGAREVYQIEVTLHGRMLLTETIDELADAGLSIVSVSPRGDHTVAVVAP